MSEPTIQLGLRENWAQFSLLVLVNAFVGAMVGMERSILPAIAEDEFQLAARTAILSFIVVFGVTKALTNYFAGRWSDRFGRKAVLVAGYQTFVTGKWGVGHAGDNLPHRFGFDRSYVLDATGASNYAAVPYVPLYTEVSWFDDGQRVDIPDDFYSSRDYVDRMIGYIDEADPERPFFGFLAASSASARRPVMNTLAPSAAKALASARPMPELPPVTITRF